jgi:hypothetical protein
MGNSGVLERDREVSDLLFLLCWTMNRMLMRRRRMRSIRPRMQPILAFVESFCQKVWDFEVSGAETMVLGEVVWLGIVRIVVGMFVVEVSSVVEWEDAVRYSGAKNGFGSGVVITACEIVFVVRGLFRIVGALAEADIDEHSEAGGGPGSLMFEMAKLVLINILVIL